MPSPLDTLNALKVSGNLPSMPQVLVQLIDSCHDPECQLQALARIVDKDAAIGAKILQLANSAFIGARRTIVNLEQAIVYLGADTIRNLAISISVQQIFRRVETNGLLSIDRYWHHSYLSALLARNIATTVGHADPSEAYLAGLLHDIGKLLLWMAFPGRYAPLLLRGVRCHSGRLAFLEEEKLRINHCEAGAWLCTQWRLPSFLADALRYHHHPLDEVAQALPLVRIVSLCDLLAHGGGKDPDCLVAADRCFHLTPTQVARLYHGVEEQVERIAADLGIRIPRGVQSSHDLEPEGEEVHKEVSLGLINRVRDISQLTGLLDNLLQAEDMERITATVEQGLKILFNEDACLLLVQHHDGALHCLTSADNRLAREVRGMRFTADLLGDSLAGQALRLRQIRHSFDPDNAAPRSPGNLLDAQLLRLLGTEGMVAIPLLHKGEVLGLLLVGLAKKSSPMLGQTTPLGLLAGHAALRLSLERLKESQAEQLAVERTRSAKLVARKIAHEINNPVAILRNHVHLLGRKISQGLPVAEELRVLDTELARIGKITRALEDLALEGVTPQIEPVDLNTHLEETLRLFRAALPEDNHIRLHFQPCPGSLIAQADQDRLRQILHNLLGNALEALTDDGGVITVRTAPSLETAIVTVEDDGPGIDPEQQATLFSVGQSNKGGRHNGLGLAIVASLATQMGGAITCASRPGRTIFTLTLPA